MIIFLVIEVFKNLVILDIYVYVIIIKMLRLGWGIFWKNGRVIDILFL